MTKRKILGILALVMLVVGVAVFATTPGIFNVHFVPKTTRFETVTVDLGKALEHYYDMNGRYPETENEDELLSILKQAHYLPNDANIRAGEFQYNPINHGQTYELLH